MRLTRFAPFIVFALVSLIGAGLTTAIYRSERATNHARFELVADDVAGRIRNRINQHIALLYATVSFLEASGREVTRSAFARFVSGLGLERQFQGVQGIGLSRILGENGREEVRNLLRANYGVERELWPAGQREVHTAIVLLEPQDERNHASLGFDMFSEARRREAMHRAITTGEISATAPVSLVEELSVITQMGFVVYHPLMAPATAGRPGRTIGFVYASFRASDLHDAALGDDILDQVELETRDIRAPDNPILYATPGFSDQALEPSFVVTREIEVAGRIWTLTMRESEMFQTGFGYIYTLTTGLTSLLLAIALAAAVRWQIRALQAAEELRAASEKAAEEKDMMLREMKHRIKNSITRILAIARQTATVSGNLEEFSRSFDARLQSMATAQDILTRSRWQGADLRDLLNAELEQVYGTTVQGADVNGPVVRLDERQTQALGLTFHELATNSLKYGAGAHPGGRLTIGWLIEHEKDGKFLRLTWREDTVVPATAPDQRGFGTRLIDANIRGELGGSIDRRYHDDGIMIEIRIPFPAGERRGNQAPKRAFKDRGRTLR